MIVNTKVRYGLRTVIELAKDTERQGVLQKEISLNQNISVKYLDSIIAGLKASGLVTTLSGRGSGYLLTKKPSEITVYDIYRAFESELAVVQCLILEGVCGYESQCLAKSFWSELNSAMEKTMSGSTIQDLLERRLTGI